MKFNYLLYTLLACLFVTSATNGQTEKTLSNGNNAFAFDLFKKLYSNDNNVFFSPYSIRSALAMTYSGAENETKNQMSKVLHFNLNNTTTAQEFLDFDNKIKTLNLATTLKISIANALWKKEDARFPFKEDYLGLTKKYYNASIFPLPSKAKPINDWVSEKTNGKIPSIITDKDITSLTRLILTNAIYFKGEWQDEFEKENTKKEKFKMSKEVAVDVDMMFQKTKVGYFEDNKTQAIKLFYREGTIYMTLILPKENSSIEALMKEIQSDIIANNKYNYKKVEIFIPKFKFESRYDLADKIGDMGMPDAFNRNKADFSGMITKDKLSIGKIIHKAFVEVNEKGTEAAAATAIDMSIGTSAMPKPEKPIIFKADRPFLVLISEYETGNILFMGTIVNPNLN